MCATCEEERLPTIFYFDDDAAAAGRASLEKQIVGWLCLLALNYSC